MPVPEWSNEGTEMNLRAVMGKALGLPVYLEGDWSARIFTGAWEAIDDSATTPFALAPPQYPVTPAGELGNWTLVAVSWDPGAPRPATEGELYRYSIDMSGVPLLFGRLRMVAEI